MRIVTPASYRAEMTKRYPGVAWPDNPPECAECGQASPALAEFDHYSDYGDLEFSRLCATCLQEALDGVKAAGHNAD